ncbi:DNA replication/repair protein RecF [Agarilytica rhodophyticola]|uniref:DNA replication/repair protein RecF n=1 Tax=Agarilytica rhodophyticola TaxID=1737490 RepID=UPI000B348958|nr:DNA replication/repair protein RecF [Agarilytica rhodophyticola]
MPFLSKLVLQNFRNISSASVELDPHLNLIIGPNGSGKSSFLESLSVLAHGRSYRTHKFRNMIRDTQKEFVLFSHVIDEQGGTVPIGIQRNRGGEFKIKLGERSVNSSAALAEKLPLILIDANSFKLLEGGPKERRRYFDWLVFHVKHEFSDLWKQVSRCIKQRNSLLRHGKISYSEVEPWDMEISRISESIEALRIECFEALTVSFSQVLANLGSARDAAEIIESKNISMEYFSGWKEEDLNYEEQLRLSYQKDLQYGYTTLGPHKADLRIKSGKQVATEILSRGQQKLLISALFIAEAKVFKNETNRNPIFAIDDLPSELDEDNQKILGTWLEEFDSQLFITGINNDFVERIWADSKREEKPKMFHVKHGTLS